MFRKKKTRKNTSGVIAIAVILTMFYTNTLDASAETMATFDEFMEETIEYYKEIHPNSASIIDELARNIIASDTYIQLYRDYPDECIETVKKTLDTSLNISITTTAYNPNQGIFYSNYQVPYVNQIYSNYCGPASVAMALIGSGLLANAETNKNINALNSHASSMKTEELSVGTYEYKVAKRLNYFISGRDVSPYYYLNITRYNLADMWYFIQGSFYHGYTPIISCYNTEDLSYYNGAHFNHYIVIESIDIQHQTVTLVDSHYDPRYAGRRQVSMANFEYTMQNGGRNWLIHG